MPYTENDILRFAFADHAFREARAVTESLLTVPCDPNGHLCSGSIAGIAVSYCRPFMSGNGLGSLPDEYRSFPSTNFERIHRTIFEARNKMTAHMDLMHAANLHALGDIQHHPGEVTVHLTTLGANFVTTATYIHPDRLPEILSLCNFQIARIGDTLASVGAELLTRHGRLGTLVFRVH
jgi:hypothetical protein